MAFITMNLDLKSLRDHQRKGYGLQKDSIGFKPTPPVSGAWLDLCLGPGLTYVWGLA